MKIDLKKNRFLKYGNSIILIDFVIDFKIDLEP
jgi:hypothetical protein